MRRTIIVLLSSLALVGCAGTDQRTTERTVGGAGLGALSGLAIGAVTGNAGRGAAIGAIAGATGGFVYDQISKDQGGN